MVELGEWREAAAQANEARAEAIEETLVNLANIEDLLRDRARQSVRETAALLRAERNDLRDATAALRQGEGSINADLIPDV